MTGLLRALVLLAARVRGLQLVAAWLALRRVRMRRNLLLQEPVL